jgi:hypothetical protein
MSQSQVSRKNKRKNVSWLIFLRTAGWVHCFSHAENHGDKIVIRKGLWSPEAPTFEQCSGDEMQQIEYSFK